jgi:hypothetical protein
MPDARPPDAAPAPLEEWGQALAALPLEAPPAGSWERVARQLPRRRSPARYWVPAALAASLALLFVAPWKGQQPAELPNTRVAHHSPATQVAPGSTAPADASKAAPVATSVAASNTAPPAITREQATPAPQLQLQGQPRRGNPAPRLLGSTQPAATVPANDASLDKPSAPPVLQAAGESPATAVAATPAPPPTQEELYAESARLEALLSQIRDDRVSSGTAMALSAELHERITGIDAALSQPELDAGQRMELWRERVATLQRLTGVESTQRWMAANGYRADGQVAQVY